METGVETSPIETIAVLKKVFDTIAKLEPIDKKGHLCI
jgi:hypothetical protein